MPLLLCSGVASVINTLVPKIRNPGKAYEGFFYRSVGHLLLSDYFFHLVEIMDAAANLGPFE